MVQRIEAEPMLPLRGGIAQRIGSQPVAGFMHRQAKKNRNQPQQRREHCLAIQRIPKIQQTVQTSISRIGYQSDNFIKSQNKYNSFRVVLQEFLQFLLHASCKISGSMASFLLYQKRPAA
jgi:hypothetical protein